MRRWIRFAALCACATWLAAAAAVAQQDAAAVLEVRFTPTARAQLAIWVEDGEGRFLTTVGLTEGTAYRGLGNRPGASQMNSGYRWPYGRREGILPVWATRRASAPGARRFDRVIFQDRSSEGRASRTSADQSVDDYYCLSFDRATTTRDALDAMSCASVFTSDKGRFITQADVDAAYAEPWEDPATGAGSYQPLSLRSLYPPRMDVTPCSGSGCYDHPDLGDFADHAREVMPEIDAVTMATPPGGVAQSVLFTVPEAWPAGDYRLMVEAHVEGDYNAAFDDTSYPTPSAPSEAWDSWAKDYGYPYRGQPSVVYAVDFSLGAASEVTHTTGDVQGRSSWSFWDAGFGEMEAAGDITDDPVGAPGSGADRLMAAADGTRLTVVVRALRDFTPADPAQDPWDGVLPEPQPEAEPAPSEDPSGNDPDSLAEGDGPDGAQGGEPGTGGAAGDGSDAPPEDGAPSGAVDAAPDPDGGDSRILVREDDGLDGPVGPVVGLKLSHHAERLHAHEWVRLRFRAVESRELLHRYEVRVSTRPIIDEASFIRDGRPAKTASEDAEGAVSLMLPTEVQPGEAIESEIGDLVADTHYYVAIRGVDVLNRAGPISVAEITTRTRVFATVTPCFVATAAYGTPLAAEVGVLRRFRDRHLLAHGPGRALVRAYYRHGPAAAAWLRRAAPLRAAARWALEPVVALLKWVEG